jgi:hypothetical protein
LGGCTGVAAPDGGAGQVAASALAGHEPPPVTATPTLPASVGSLAPPPAEGPVEAPELLGSVSIPVTDLPVPEPPELHAPERIAKDKANSGRNCMTAAYRDVRLMGLMPSS